MFFAKKPIKLGKYSVVKIDDAYQLLSEDKIVITASFKDVYVDTFKINLLDDEIELIKLFISSLKWFKKFSVTNDDGWKILCNELSLKVDDGIIEARRESF